MHLNDRLLAELSLRPVDFTSLMRLPAHAVAGELAALQSDVRLVWRDRAFALHPDRCATPGAEDLYKELGAYVSELLALTPADIPSDRTSFSVETPRGNLQVVFRF